MLTISGIYPFDPDYVLKELSRKPERFITPPPTDAAPSSLIKTPTTKDELDAMLQSLNPYSPHNKFRLSRVKKAFNLINADRVLAQDSTRLLFKANMARQARKKKTKEDGLKGGYPAAYGRVLTEVEAKRHRDDEAKKMDEIRRKKQIAEAKKIAVADRKRIEAEGVIERKRKREEAKMQKELEKASKPKRIYRRNLQNPSILIDPAIETEEIQDQGDIPSIGGYVYP